MSRWVNLPEGENPKPAHALEFSGIRINHWKWVLALIVAGVILGTLGVINHW